MPAKSTNKCKCRHCRGIRTPGCRHFRGLSSRRATCSKIGHPPHPLPLLGNSQDHNQQRHDTSTTSPGGNGGNASLDVINKSFGGAFQAPYLWATCSSKALNQVARMLNSLRLFPPRGANWPRERSSADDERLAWCVQGDFLGRGARRQQLINDYMLLNWCVLSSRVGSSERNPTTSS